MQVGSKEELKEEGAAVPYPCSNRLLPRKQSDMEGTIPSPTDKRVAVVTGANKGIGLEICRQLASKGVMVVLTARDENRGKAAVEKLKEAGLSDVTFHQLDVTDRASIACLADFIRNHFGKLDILVNNAGIGGLTTDLKNVNHTRIEDDKKNDHKGDVLDWMKNLRETYERAEECLRTNYHGTKYVIEALLPFLQSSYSARVVNVSSTLGQLKVITNPRVKEELSQINGPTEERLDELSQWFLRDFKEGLLEANGWPAISGAYKLSKVLVNAYTRVLAKRYPNLSINCVSPGYVKTDLNWNNGILSVEVGARGPVMLALLPDSSSSGLFFDQTEVSSF